MSSRQRRVEKKIETRLGHILVAYPILVALLTVLARYSNALENLSTQNLLIIITGGSILYMIYTATLYIALVIVKTAGRRFVL